MKAAIIKDYEGLIEIEDIGTPTIRDDSVLIAVHAASVNPIDDGHITTVIDSAYPIAQTAAAYDALASRHAVGKIVVTVP